MTERKNSKSPDVRLRNLSLRWRKEWNIIWGHLYLKNKFENTAAARREAWRLIRRHGYKVPFYLIALDAKAISIGLYHRSEHV